MRQRQTGKQKPAAKQHPSPERGAYPIKYAHAAPLNSAYDPYLRSFIQSSLEQPRSHHASFSGSPVSLPEQSPKIDPQVVKVLEDSQLYRNQLIYSILSRTQSAYPGAVATYNYQPDILRRLSLVEKRLGIPQAPPYQQSTAALQVKALMRANLRIRLLKYQIARQYDKIDVQNMQIARLREESNGGLGECRTRLSVIEKYLAELSAGFFEIYKAPGTYQVYQIATLEAKQNKIIYIIRSYKDAIQQYIERQDTCNVTYQDNSKQAVLLIEAKASDTAKYIAEIKRQLLYLQDYKICYLSSSSNGVACTYDGFVALQYEVAKLRLENTNILLLLSYYRKASYSSSNACPALESIYTGVLDTIYPQLAQLEYRIAGLEDRSTESEMNGIERDISNIIEAVGENQTQIVDLSSEIYYLGAVVEELTNKLKRCEELTVGIEVNTSWYKEVGNRVAELENALKPLQNDIPNDLEMRLVLDELSKQISMLTEEYVRLRERYDSCSVTIQDTATTCRDPSQLEQYCYEQVAYVINYVSALRAEFYARLAAYESSLEKNTKNTNDAGETDTAVKGYLSEVALKLIELRDVLAGVRDQMQQDHYCGQKNAAAIVDIYAYMQAFSSTQTIANVENIAQQIKTLFDTQKDNQEQIAEMERQIGFVQQFLMTGLAQGEEMSEEQRSESQ